MRSSVASAAAATPGRDQQAAMETEADAYSLSPVILSLLGLAGQQQRAATALAWHGIGKEMEKHGKRKRGPPPPPGEDMAGGACKLEPARQLPAGRGRGWSAGARLPARLSDPRAFLCRPGARSVRLLALAAELLWVTSHGQADRPADGVRRPRPNAPCP